LSNLQALTEQRLLIFGGTGAIGLAIRQKFQGEGWQAVVVSRSALNDISTVQWDPSDPEENENADQKTRAVRTLKELGPFDAVCWAQGVNCNDSIYDVDVMNHEKIYRANVLYVLTSLQTLLTERLLRKPARLCVISSIWQTLARQSKLSYCISKAALQGLVLSAAADLARDGHVINAVLPGVIDTPMTRKNLSESQVRKVEDSTLFGRLPTLEEVASTVFGLCKADATAVTGQFISVDLGYSSVRVI
jgi:3-oxoacyl-[acyl-carrier protein] reductase